MINSEILVLKIGNSNISFSAIDKKEIRLVSTKELLEKFEEFCTFFNIFKIIYICSQNEKILQKLKSRLISNLIINKYLKNELIDYSNIEKSQLGFDLYYALEYLANSNKDFTYLSLGTFSVFAEVVNRKITNIEIYLSLSLELSNINFDFSLANNLNEEKINNRTIIKRTIIEPKRKLIKKFLKTSPFISGNEINFYDFAYENEKYNDELEIRAMKFFINKKEF